MNRIMTENIAGFNIGKKMVSRYYQAVNFWQTTYDVLSQGDSRSSKAITGIFWHNC